MKTDKLKSRYMSSENRKTWKDLAIILLIVTIAVLTAYKMNGIYPFGSKSIARGDMVQQTIPAGMYYVWDVLHGKASPFFTWNSGLGMNISGAVSLGALFSPLNLFLYFSTRSYLYNFANILMILKMIAIAYAMYFYLKKYNTERIVHIMGGVLYAFGAASLVHFQIMMIMDVAFLLPLIMIGIDRIFEDKGCLFFIVFFTMAMMVNVYTGCITLIYLLLSSGARTFLEDDREKGQKRKWILRLGMSVFVSLLLSAVVVIPALRCIAEAPRSGDADLLTTYVTALQAQWSDYEWGMVERMCVNMALPCACIIGFLALKGEKTAAVRKYRGHIFVVICLLLSVVVPSMELLWHGGSRASWPVRFIYVISFVLIDFAVLLYQDHRKTLGKAFAVSSKWITAAACVAACIAAGMIFGRVYEAYCSHSAYATLGDGFLCLVIEAVFAGIYVFLLKSHTNKISVLVILCAQLAVTSLVSFAPNKENATVFSSEYLDQVNEVGKNMETDTEAFERIKNTDYKLDHIDYALVLGKQAISNYWHVISPDLQPNFSALGYSINWTQLLDAGGTIFSDTLLHIQYDLSYRELPGSMYSLCEAIDNGSGEQIGLYRNNLEFPFAIQTNTQELAASGDLFHTQNTLFQAVTGSSDTLIQDVSEDINGSVYGTQVGKGRRILYFYGTNSTDQPVSIVVNGEQIYIPNSDTSENISYPKDFGNGLICLGSFEDETVEVQFGGDVDASMLHLGWLDYDMLQSAAEAIQQDNGGIALLTRKHAGVKLIIENVTKDYVFLPISYDKGWSCKVNGKKVTPHSIDGMLSVPVEKGTDNIVLRYTPDGRKTGAVISVIALIMCLGCAYLLKKGRITQDQKGVVILSGIAYEIFGILFAVFVALLFAVPALYYLKGIFISMQQ